ncbi:hypothetical protein HYFRA_00011644 [Hymenoscyphus fraxineus]|uniref:Uncharacterized protein n=1 Tax=Hymenoscyphus fraxineus TaxID=746836 RepID=A0A9N9PU18_9HELO|nr:hypothetical protein HYFRA_00011644 [Hymenoscyphus fraxineus]
MKMARSSSFKKLALALALTTVATNTTSIILLTQSYDELYDSWNIAQSYGWYLHVSSVFSLFGFIGALRHDTLSLKIFSNFLIGDALLSTFLRVMLINGIPGFGISDTLCLKSEETPLSTRSEDGCTKIVTANQVILTAVCIIVMNWQTLGALACMKQVQDFRESEEEERGPFYRDLEEGVEDALIVFEGEGSENGEGKV